MPCNFMYVATHWIRDQYMCRAKSNENCFSGTRKKVKYGGIWFGILRKISRILSWNIISPNDHMNETFPEPLKHKFGRRQVEEMLEIAWQLFLRAIKATNSWQVLLPKQQRLWKSWKAVEDRLTHCSFLSIWWFVNQTKKYIYWLKQPHVTNIPKSSSVNVTPSGIERH